jgi:hypothetical protein
LGTAAGLLAIIISFALSRNSNANAYTTPSVFGALVTTGVTPLV